MLRLLPIVFKTFGATRIVPTIFTRNASIFGNQKDDEDRILEYLALHKQKLQYDEDARKNDISHSTFMHPLSPAEKNYTDVSTNEMVCGMGIEETCRRVQGGEFTAEEVVFEHKARLEALQDSYRYFITPTTAAAMEMAKLCDAGIARDRRGVVFHTKDLGGMTLSHTQGSLAHLSTIGRYAHGMDNLLFSHGASFIGKTRPSEFGFEAEGTNDIVGVLRNPYNPLKTVGGSSAGAIACGVGHIGIANDGSGSIRIPASFCGVVGLKPSNSLRFHSREPYTNFAAGINWTSYGFITRSVRDSALTMDMLTDKEHLFLSSLNTKTNLRVAYLPTHPYSKVNELVSTTVQKLVDDLKRDGVNITTVKDIGIQQDPEQIVAKLWRGSLNQFTNYDTTKLDKYLQKLLQTPISVEEFKDAQLQANIIKLNIARFFDDYDLLITPTVAVLPWSAGQTRPVPDPEKLVDYSWNPFTYLFNWTNQSAISIPCGFVLPSEKDVLSLPVGMQVVVKDTGRPVEDLRMLLQFAQKAFAMRESEVESNRPSFAKLRYTSGK